MPVAHGILTPKALVRLRAKVAKAEAESLAVALPAEALAAVIDDLIALRKHTLGQYWAPADPRARANVLAHLTTTCTPPQLALIATGGHPTRDKWPKEISPEFEPTPIVIDPGDSEGGAP